VSALTGRKKVRHYARDRWVQPSMRTVGRLPRPKRSIVEQADCGNRMWPNRESETEGRRNRNQGDKTAKASRWPPEPLVLQIRCRNIAVTLQSGRPDLNRVSIDLFPLQFPRSVARFGPTTPKPIDPNLLRSIKTEAPSDRQHRAHGEIGLASSSGEPHLQGGSAARDHGWGRFPRERWSRRRGARILRGHGGSPDGSLYTEKALTALASRSRESESRCPVRSEETVQ
jgi:hypothetical protein